MQFHCFSTIQKKPAGFYNPPYQSSWTGNQAVQNPPTSPVPLHLRATLAQIPLTPLHSTRTSSVGRGYAQRPLRVRLSECLDRRPFCHGQGREELGSPGARGAAR
jgi:hypothetical protein